MARKFVKWLRHMRNFLKVIEMLRGTRLNVTFVKVFLTIWTLWEVFFSFRFYGDD
jgi:hypothetical protein